MILLCALQEDGIVDIVDINIDIVVKSIGYL